MISSVYYSKNKKRSHLSNESDFLKPHAISKAKYKDLFYAAQDLFFRFGLHKVSVDEICTKAKVSKMTFYKEFENKSQLALVVYEFYNANAARDTQQLLDLPIDFLEMVERLILLKQKYSKQMGATFIKDIMAEREIFSQLMEKSFKKQKQLRLKILQRGKKEGYIRPEVDGDLFELLLQNFSNLLQQHNFLEKYPDIEKLSRLGTELFFYGLSNCREKIPAMSQKQKKVRQQASKEKRKTVIPKSQTTRRK